MYRLSSSRPSCATIRARSKERPPLSHRKVNFRAWLHASLGERPDNAATATTSTALAGAAQVWMRLPPTTRKDIADRRGIERPLHLAGGRFTREADPMTNADYRYMAREIRDLIPLLVHPRPIADLRLLADRYERLAHYLEEHPGKLPDTSLVKPRDSNRN